MVHTDILMFPTRGEHTWASLISKCAIAPTWLLAKRQNDARRGTAIQVSNKNSKESDGFEPKFALLCLVGKYSRKAKDK